MSKRYWIYVQDASTTLHSTRLHEQGYREGWLHGDALRGEMRGATEYPTLEAVEAEIARRGWTPDCSVRLGRTTAYAHEVY